MSFATSPPSSAFDLSHTSSATHSSFDLSHSAVNRSSFDVTHAVIAAPVVDGALLALFNNLEDLFSMEHIRLDSWCLLRETLLVETQSLSLDEILINRKKIVAILSAIECVATFYAYPPKNKVQELLALISHESLDVRALTERVAEIYSTLLAYEKGPAIYFEVLFVGENVTEYDAALIQNPIQSAQFFYNIVHVTTAEEALTALLLNTSIQVAVISTGWAVRAPFEIGQLRKIYNLSDLESPSLPSFHKTILLGRQMKKWMPNISIFQLSSNNIEKAAGVANSPFSRTFTQSSSDIQELHLSILESVDQRYRTPFFDCLVSYSRRPFGVFHALPLARGASLLNSGPLVSDFHSFYGQNIFNAETSATTGLDSLLEPVSVISEAQQLAAQCYGALHSFWVTNGTSTANKIVAQAVLSPGDIVLIDGNCHKSHLYSMILVGAFPIFLDSYPLPEYATYGGVPLHHIKRTLLTLRNEGKLHRVKMLLLTNITFDGFAYNCIRIMEECLAIKPDLIFLWDEAWWAFARYHPLTRLRTAMYSAQVLATRYASPEYAEQYRTWKGDDNDLLSIDDLETLVSTRLLPDPSRARIRVYSTQSTHKTLTAFRQGSMIHVYDQDFQRMVKRAFEEAYFTHTSTSPNYQILASLDVGRRQVALAGYKLVNRQLHEAIQLRAMLTNNPLINKYFEPCAAEQLIPSEFQPSRFTSYTPAPGARIDWASIYELWGENGDEFVLDPCRITIYSARSGLNGTELKHKLSMSHNIQVNKTSINTILCMTTIGTTRSAAAHLVECLTKIAQEIDHFLEHASDLELQQFGNKTETLTYKLPALPKNPPFHARFRIPGDAGEADVRTPFFQAYSETLCEYIPLAAPRLLAEELVSASLVIPYPPGFALLIPGQVITREIVTFLLAIDVKEIHGYNPAVGLRVFRQDFINDQSKPALLTSQTTMGQIRVTSPEDFMLVTSPPSVRSSRSASTGTLPEASPSTLATSGFHGTPQTPISSGHLSTAFLSPGLHHAMNGSLSPTSFGATQQSTPSAAQTEYSVSQEGLYNPLSPTSMTLIHDYQSGFQSRQGAPAFPYLGDAISPPTAGYPHLQADSNSLGIVIPSLNSFKAAESDRPEILSPTMASANPLSPNRDREIFNLELELL